MLDIQDCMRNLRNIDAVAERLATRGFTLDKATFQNLESERKTTADAHPGSAGQPQQPVETGRHAQGPG
jgi:hypothetical protein